MASNEYISPYGDVSKEYVKAHSSKEYIPPYAGVTKEAIDLKRNTKTVASTVNEQDYFKPGPSKQAYADGVVNYTKFANTESDIFNTVHYKSWNDYLEKNLENYGMVSRQNFDPYNKLYRFGYLNPYDAVQNGREYLFFVKPDLFLVGSKIKTVRSKVNGLSPNDIKLNGILKNNPFWIDLKNKWPNVFAQLQWSAMSNPYPFSLLLTNTVTSTLDLPGLSSANLSTPTNIFGTNYEYRGSSEASNDNFNFSLEFKDTKWLDTYMFFRAYEEYEDMKSKGQIRFYDEKVSSNELARHFMQMIEHKRLHDQFGIYKFITMEDGETILHYSYFCGCMWTSLPRDSFNSPEFSDGVIKYGIDGKCAFVQDMKPNILRNFNRLVLSYIHGKDLYSSNSTHRSIMTINGYKYAPIIDMTYDDMYTDMRPVVVPLIYTSKMHGRDVYKLKFLRKE